MTPKPLKTKVVAFKVESELADLLSKIPNKSAFIRKAIAAQQGGKFKGEIAPVTIDGRKGPTVIDADEIEPPGLVGGEGEADLVGVQPARHAARAGDVRRRQLR